MHGGLSPDLKTLDQIRTIERNQEIPHKGAFCDLVWSDPEDVETWAISPRGAGWLFGAKVTNEVSTRKIIHSRLQSTVRANRDQRWFRFCIISHNPLILVPVPVQVLASASVNVLSRTQIFVCCVYLFLPPTNQVIFSVVCVSPSVHRSGGSHVLTAYLFELVHLGLPPDIFELFHLDPPPQPQLPVAFIEPHPRPRPPTHIGPDPSPALPHPRHFQDCSLAESRRLGFD